MSGANCASWWLCPEAGCPVCDSLLVVLEDVLFDKGRWFVEQAVAPTDQQVEQRVSAADGEFDWFRHGAEILLDGVGGQPHFKP